MFDQLKKNGIISTRGLKEDATTYCELLFDVNSAYFYNHGGYEFAKQFYADAYRAATEIVGGEQYILSATMHADERNRAVSEALGEDIYHYHLHVVYIPVVEKQILWSKRCKDKSLMQRFYEFKTNGGKILISDLYRGYVLLILYVQHIITDQKVDPNEEDIKAHIISRFNCGDTNFFDIFHCGTKVVACFKEFCCKYESMEKIGFIPDLMFKVLPKYQVAAFVDIAELNQRGVQCFETVWDYNYYELTDLDTDSFIEKVNAICESWFSKLPSIYNELFDSLFEKNTYRFKGKFEYRNEYIGNGKSGPWISSIIREYDSNIFTVTHNPHCSESISEEDKLDGLLFIRTSILIERFLQRKMLFYDGVRCLLYHGICKKLGYDNHGLSFNGMNYMLF